MAPLDPTILDFANHRADATKEDIKTLVEGTLKYHFNSVFVNPLHVAYAKSLVGDKTKVGTVISFPLGQDTRDVKRLAIQTSVINGADELDIVPDISVMKSGNNDFFLLELQVLTTEAKKMRGDVIVKWIIETGLFIDEQGKDIVPNGKDMVKNAALMIQKAGADYVKLCSGMGKRGVSEYDVALVREAVGPTMNIKGAGGIDTLEEALALVKAGANRLGTSHAIEIINGAHSHKNTTSGE